MAPSNSGNQFLTGLPRKIIGSVVFGVVVYLIISVWAIWDKPGLGNFAWGWFPVLLALAAGNYALRFGKWQYYLAILKTPVPWRDSLIIFLSGLALSITPSKLGEVVRSYFLKRGYDIPMTKTAPIVLADRLSDTVALVILAAAGSLSYHYGASVVWGVAAAVALIFVVVTVRPLGEFVLRLAAKLPGVGSRLEHVQALYESAVILLDWRRVTLPLVLSVLAWSLEAYGFSLTLHGFGLNTVPVLDAIFIYAFSTLVGAASMLPGGLGATEGVLTGLMKLVGVTLSTAALAAIIIRAATLWFGVLVGVACLRVAERRWVRG